jgi:membrane protein implicated in regulation of membrane protease activity
MAMPLVLGVVGFEQLLHTGPGGPPVYQLLHWLSDSLMALPLGVAAVWLGSRLAQRKRRTSSDTLARACLIAIVFAVLLVPGGIVHEQIDTLTQAHKAVSVHTHGQLVGLPLLLVALAWIARRRPLTTPRTPTGAFHETRIHLS